MVDDEVRGHQRIDLRGIAAEVGDGVSHPGQVHDRGHAGKVLEQDPGRHERDLAIGNASGPPAGEHLDVRRAHEAAAGMPEHVLEEDPQGDRSVIEVQPIGYDGESVVVRLPRAKARSRIVRVVVRHQRLLP